MKTEKTKDQGEAWAQALKLAKSDDEQWLKRGKLIVKRYRDERETEFSTAKKYNILWANIQTLFPAIYAKTPKPEVERRFKDSDNVGRTASQILERALAYDLESNTDFDSTMRGAVLDRLLPGRGVAWVRVETKNVTSTGGQETPQVAVVVDYVYWEDFRCSPARTWEDVDWVARRVYMSKAEVIERFGEQFKDVSLSHVPVGLEDMTKRGENCDHLKKAKVWEIWDKTKKQVCWVAEEYKNQLDCKPDPYGLDNFFPCPKPLYATQTTDTLVPVADFSLYQDQAQELDSLTQRIFLLTQALKVVGVYDASQSGIQRMLNEGTENTLIPVDTWAAFSEKGGIKGTVDFLPLDMVVNALNACYASREQAKQVIYEITGLSDIIRGASVASETATAQQIKSQFASLRLKDHQKSVAQFASEILRIKAQLMCDLYPEQQLVQMSGIMGTEDAQFAEPAIQLLKTEPARNFRIDVAADSLVEIDEQAEKASRVEFLQAAGGFLQQALPVAQQAPEITPLLAEMLLFGIRSFKAGRPLEAAFDNAMAQLSAPKPPEQPQPDPEQIKMQGQMQIEQMRLQAKQQADQMAFDAKMQSEQIQAQAKIQVEAAKMEMEMRLEEARAEREMMLEQMRMNNESMMTKFTEMLRAEVTLNTAQISANSTISEQQDAASEQSLNNSEGN